jgi:hypothetical protein
MATAFREVTDWGPDFPTINHTYLLDNDKMLAYIPKGTSEPFWFKRPIVISKSRRKFQICDVNPFKIKENPALIKVQGSRGEVYLVDPVEKTCSCLGFQYRGQCKHTKDLK